MKKRIYLTLVCLSVGSLVAAVPAFASETGKSAAVEVSDTAHFTGYEAEGLPTELTIGQTGQLKRPADHYLAKTEYSFAIEVSDPSVLSFNEKGEWKALKEGTVQVHYQLSDVQKNEKFREELERLGIKQDWTVQEVAMKPITITVKSNKVSFTGYEAEGLPTELEIGQTGQLKRPADHYLAKTEYSFAIEVSDPSVLSFNEKGEWKALKEGTVQVHYQLSDVQKNEKFREELERLGIKQDWTVQEVSMEPITITVKDPAEVLFRLYNPNSGEHFYTANPKEQRYLVSLGWKDEGLGWIAPAKGKDVYRLYNPNAGDHHYTTSAGERDALVKAGWNYEGVSWHSGEGAPLYRIYNPNAKAGAHHYTLSAAEKNYLVSIGWKDEGIGWNAN